MRAPGTDPALPTIGTGDYDWRGFVPFAGHAQGDQPRRRATILNWNNRPAANVGAADSNFSYGSVHRVDLLRAAVAGRKKHTLVTLTGAMNKAATQDLRVVRVWPIIRAVLQTGAAPSARAEAAAGLLDSWRSNGSSRLDRELDGKVDDPGAAVMDAAWPRHRRRGDDARARAARRPARGAARAERRRRPRRLRVHLGLVRLRRQGPADAPRPRGARPVLAPLLRRGRARDVPRGAVGAIDAAAAELETTQGPAPSSWRADATAERIRFTSGVLPDTMRWSNRPTFQQLMSFSGHRPR